MSWVRRYDGMRCVPQTLRISHSVSDGLHDPVVTPRRRTRRNSYYQIHLGPKVDVIARFSDWSFDRELPRLSIDRDVHKAIERRRNIILSNPISLQRIRQIPKNSRGEAPGRDTSGETYPSSKAS